MSALEPLIACAGTWRGTNTLQDPNTNLPDDSPSTATVTPLLGGRFVRIDYTWSYQDTPHDGSMLIGNYVKGRTITVHWVDSMHMGQKVMACEGPAPEDGPTLSVRGSYTAPPGPDWGWRIDITPEADKLRITMFNIWPEGAPEDLAVQAVYSRS